MKAWFRLLPLILAATLFTGCAQNGLPTTTGSETGTSSAQTGSSVTSTSESDKKAGYWLTDNKVSYTYMLSNNSITDLNKVDPFFQKMEEMTNVHIDWNIVSTTDIDTKKSLMWAGNELPDVIGGGCITTTEFLKYAPAGKFFPINTLMEQCMPNFLAAANGEHEGIIKALTLSDGNIYSLPEVSFSNMSVTSAIHINKVWLDKLNLKVPTTTDEFFNVLKAFKEQDPNGNGAADEIPFAFDPTRSWQNGAINGWFGVTDEWMIKDGTVTYSPYMDGWKELAAYLNKLWDAGLMDPELYTQDSSTFNAKAQQNPDIYGSMMLYGKFVQLTGDNYDDYEILLPQKSGTAISGAVRSRIGTHYWNLLRAVISKDVANPDILLRWFDVFYDPYYGEQVLNGALDYQTKLRDDGSFELVEDVPEGYSSRSDWIGQTHTNQFPFTWNEKTHKYLLESSNEIIEGKEQSEAYTPYFINEVMDYNFMLNEESEGLAKYSTDIKKYVNEMFALWVTGERDVQADWDEYKAHLEQLGVKDYAAIYQSYYDRVTAK